MSVMGYTLTYTAILTGSNGDTFSWSGQQVIATTTPQAGDLQSAATAMGSDISAQMTTGPNPYPVQAATDGDSGGEQA